MGFAVTLLCVGFLCVWPLLGLLWILYACTTSLPPRLPSPHPCSSDSCPNLSDLHCRLVRRPTSANRRRSIHLRFIAANFKDAFRLILRLQGIVSLSARRSRGTDERVWAAPDPLVFPKKPLHSRNHERCFQMPVASANFSLGMVDARRKKLCSGVRLVRVLDCKQNVL